MNAKDQGPRHNPTCTINVPAYKRKSSPLKLTMSHWSEVGRGMKSVTNVNRHLLSFDCGAWWLSGKLGAFHMKGRKFESHSSRHVGTLDRSFTLSCL